MKALVTDNVHEVLLQDLKQAGYECTYFPKIKQQEVEAIIADYEILIINSKIKVDKAFLDKGIKLKTIGRLGSGLEIIDLEYAKQKNIQVYNSPEGNRDAVAEHAIGMLLALFNQLYMSHHDVVNMTWDREARRGEELMGKTVGIIGYGNTGKALAKKLSGFDVEVLFYDKYLDLPNNKYANQVALKHLQQKADVVSFHLPYNKETHYFCGESFIKGMKKDFYLINTSRGKIVDTYAIIKYLNLSKIKGICLDVFENEQPFSYNAEEIEMLKKISESPKILLSPHVAGWTFQSKFKLAKILSKKILSLG